MPVLFENLEDRFSRVEAQLSECNDLCYSETPSGLMPTQSFNLFRRGSGRDVTMAALAAILDIGTMQF